MAKPQHRTPEHRAAYLAIVRAQASGQWLICHQPVCLMTSRDIAPNDRVDVCHDDTGTRILGPGHAACNRAEAGRKRHRATQLEASWIM